MTNILVGPEAPSGSQYGESDPTAASPACCESATGRAPTWWAARGGEDPRSTTFRALAWSQDDCPADLLPYEGEDYVVPQANTAMPWYRGAARLYVIAAGVAAVAFGGLVLSTSGVDYVVTTTPITVTQPATSAPEPALDGHSANHVGATQSAAPAPPPAPSQPTGPPARAAHSDANGAPTATIAPTTDPAPSPVEDTVPEIATPEVTSPAAPAPVDESPVAPPPVAPAPVAQPPVAQPPVAPAPVAQPPVDEPPLVSLPVVAPQPVPHPVGPPPVIHVPTEPAGSNPVVAGRPGILNPPSPWADHPGIMLPPQTVVIPQLPNLLGTP